MKCDVMALRGLRMDDLDKAIEMVYDHYGTCPLYYKLIELRNLNQGGTKK